MTDAELIRLLKSEIQDLQDQLEAVQDSHGNLTGLEPEAQASLDLKVYTGRLIAEALRRSGGSKTKAAAMLGIDRSSLYSKIHSKWTRLGAARPKLSERHGGWRGVA
jgi:transcriptional regulator with PAS, ATPase and Fis domain